MKDNHKTIGDLNFQLVKQGKPYAFTLGDCKVERGIVTGQTPHTITVKLGPLLTTSLLKSSITGWAELPASVFEL